MRKALMTRGEVGNIRLALPLAGTMTVIEIRPHRWGWKAFESSGVEPVLNQEDAIGYATGRACFRSGEIRVLDSSGAVALIIPFTRRIEDCN
jgi:hypothetical protein